MKTAVFITNNRNLTDLFVIEAGTHKTEPGYSVGPVVFDHFIMHFVITGKGKLDLNGITHDIEDGYGFLIKPGERALYQSDKNQPWEYIWITFNGKLADSYLNQTALTDITPVFPYNKTDALKDRIIDFINMDKTKTNESTKSLAILYDILTQISEQSAGSNPQKPLRSNKDAYVKAVMEYIIHHYNQHMDVEKMAHAIGLSRSYMNRLFHATSGLSIRDFIIKLRLDKACVLMRNNMLTLDDISRLVGYPDYAQFSKLFSMRFSHSPKIHRSMLKNSDIYNS